tara:strand:- start:3044 stop:3412 length:369 start_codon:yes stop_codon:yes gene_type:complete
VDSKNRETNTIEARATCYTILRKECHISYQEIGKYFLKNHATVIHGVNEFPYMLKYNPRLSINYELCRKMFKENNELFDDSLDVVDMMLIKKSVDKLEKANCVLSLAITKLEEELDKLKNPL